MNAATAFSSAAARLGGVTTRKMFGQPCAFLNGNMFLYTYAGELVLRLSDDDRPKLEGARPFAPKGGRGMKEYVVVPDTLLKDSTQLEAWVDRAARYAASLEPKIKGDSGWVKRPRTDNAR
jgi:TfoX/Sxy family transcriptional regulator of competence genes